MNPSTIQQAIALFQSGRFQEAAQFCQLSLARQPGDESLATLWAMSLQNLGRDQDAMPVYRQLAQARPGVSAHWANLGLVLRRIGEYGESDDAYRRALALEPRNTGFLVDYGLLLMDMGRIAEARHRFLDAVELEPDVPEARIYASLACFECGDAQRAAALIPGASGWQGLPPHLREELATALMQVGRTEEAEALLLGPGMQQSASGIIRLAQLNERTNRIEQAEALLVRARAALDTAGRQEKIDLLHLESSLAMRRKDYDAARSAASEIIALQPHVQAEANAHFTLASIADKLKDPQTAMAHLEKAHAIHFRLAEDVVPEIAHSDAEPLKVSSKWLVENECGFRHDPSAPDEKASPVFIVGFPRSGTTMLEQMLDAHPGYASMDERATLQRCIEHMEKRGLEYPQGLDRLNAGAADDLRAVYWAEVAKVIRLTPGQQLVDKNPLNMLRLPMILRLFPNAKIILALRHPCDVLLSCYMQNFRSPAFMVLCSSLERLAKSYVNAMRFWIHHQALLSPDTLVLRYEDTVGDFPAQVDRIGAFLSIDDRDFLAQFSQHAARKGYISTPSYSQVVEPVNTRAVGRWQPYARWLAPALPILQPVADHWGYDLTVR
ncbi:sulfotransferase [Pseudoxanthomonas sp. LjRoot143]|uniref:tetratricopeptide repeat-containing sulfotransferase family protein n=1 Tax=Pseudoxanthomonas sp. LjRoot143 TaxID=3342266 RepID=UPI003ECD4137